VLGLDELLVACNVWPQESNEHADMVEKARRSQVFDALADRVFKALSLRLSEEGDTRASDAMEEWWRFYSLVTSVLATESAWKAGFRALNSTHSTLCDPPLFGVNRYALEKGVSSSGY
jgi:hypothetical protein